MKFLSLILLFFANTSFAKTTVSLGVSSADSFKAEIAMDNPKQVIIQNLKTNQSQRVTFEYALIDIKKLTLSEGKKKKELLLAAVSVANEEQTVIVLSPGITIETVCSLRNEGDFSWGADQELMERLKVVVKGAKQKLQIKMSKYRNDKVTYSWVDCFSF